MRTTQIGLFLLFAAALVSTCDAQVLLRRRMGRVLGEMTLDAGTRLFDQSVQQVSENPGSVLKDARVSAKISPGPATPKVLLDQGWQNVLISETALLAEKLQAEKFSAPVLEKVYLDYVGVDPSQAGTASGKGNSWSSRQMNMLIATEKADPPAGRAAWTSVTQFERSRPRDPHGDAPPSLHCSLVYLTQKDKQKFRKTVDFDLTLEQESKQAGSKAAPWSASNMQYDRPSTSDARRP